ncbi:hypothetical protein Gotur_024203 [Gossypium turneri]
MGDGFLDRVEYNAAVRTWAEITQREKGDNLELKEIWDQWNNEVRQLFYSNYGDLPYLLDMKVDKRLFRALAQFWNSAYSCFTFGKVDLVPTIEEYTTLLQCSRVQVDIIYSKAVNVPTFLRKLMNITGMSEQWVTARIKQKGDSRCIPWKDLKDLILAHPDVGHVDEAVTDLFDRLDKRNLHEENIEWRAPWLLPDEVLYRCGDFDWVPLLGIWGAVGYAPLLVLRQYRSRQFVPATQGLAECEFSYKDDGYKKKVRKMANAWNQTRRMKRLAVGPITIPEYSEWRVKRINDNIPGPSLENSQSIEEHFRAVPSELEIIKQDFERRNTELERKIEQIEEKKVNLRLDVDVQKLEADKLRKGKNKAKEELDSLKTDYKKLRLSIRTAGLGKTSEQWREKSQKEKGELKDRVVELEGSLHQHRSRNSIIELKASLSKIEEMKGKIEKLEAALRSCEVWIEHLEAKEGCQNEQLHYFQDQVRNRDRVMGEAMVQIREVADHLQTLAVLADTLSVKYELESDRGQELASLLKKIKVLINLESNEPTQHRYGTRAKSRSMDQRLEKLEQFQKEM